MSQSSQSDDIFECDYTFPCLECAHTQARCSCSTVVDNKRIPLQGGSFNCFTKVLDWVHITYHMINHIGLLIDTGIYGLPWFFIGFTTLLTT